MDPIAYMLMSKSTGNILYDIFLIILVLPIITIFIDDLKNIIRKFFNNYFYKSKYKTISFIGWENFSYGIYQFEFQLPMMAICYHLIKHNKAENTKFFNNKMNGRHNPDFNYIQSKELHFIINNDQTIIYDENIQIDIDSYQIQMKDPTGHIIWKITLTIKTNKDLNHITKFINDCIIEYNNYITEINKNKIYHFIFQGYDDKQDRYNWKMSILSDINDETNCNFETFDNMFTINKKTLLSDLSLLKDLEYYKKTGSKRKKGYIFHGPPGCGKTSSVIAMANYDKRHIIEIPMSRIKRNADIEEILNLSQINNVFFKKEEIILLFDEIDTGLDSIKKRDSEDNINIKNIDDKEDIKDKIIKNLSGHDQKYDKYNDDKICLGSILSRFDGVGSYNGIIIVATTNCIDKISPALYRHGRLNPIHFDFMRKEDIKDMIEKFYKIVLDENQINTLPTIEDKIPPSSLRHYLENNINNIDDLYIFFKKQYNKN
jgi:hypothetical protein